MSRKLVRTCYVHRGAFCLIMVGFMNSTTRPALGGIVGGSSNIEQITAPSSVEAQALEHDTAIYVFPERQARLLGQAISVNLSQPGTATGSSPNPSANTISGGTLVNSYYVHYDSVGLPNPEVGSAGSLTFDTDVLGIIVLRDMLNSTNSDPGLFPLVTYATGDLAGIENVEVVTLSNDRRVVDFSFATGSAGDNIRIITAVPEPGIALLTTAALGIVCGTRRARLFQASFPQGVIWAIAAPTNWAKA